MYRYALRDDINNYFIHLYLIMQVGIKIILNTASIKPIITVLGDSNDT